MSAARVRRYPRYAIFSPNAANVQTNNKASSAIFALPVISLLTLAKPAPARKIQYPVRLRIAQGGCAHLPPPRRLEKFGARTPAARIPSQTIHHRAVVPTVAQAHRGRRLR